MAALNRRNRVGLCGLLGALLLISGCSHRASMHWPWSHKTEVPPTPVSVLVETGANGDGASYPQYWKRNTLVVDLHAASGEGALVVTLPAGAQWPARLAFRVTPGSIGVLEVRGEQRVVLPVSSQGHTPIDLELPPSSYMATTAKITIRWSAQ